jgi:prepilin-type N-terminal cleavage/methylation domain-containing protein
MRRRSGFTLVEMLVAVALVVFIMVILSEAYAASMASFRTLKALGDMDAKLRGVATVLRNDLAADHFDGKKRLSDPNIWADEPPREGFFRIWQGSPISTTNSGANYFQEGHDGDGIFSNKAVDHYLHFTSKKRGNKRGDFYTGQVGDPNSPLFLTNPNFFGQPADERYQDVPGTVTSQWAEIIYFMRPNGAMAGGITPLYALYRRQLLAVPNNTDLNWNQTYQVLGTNYSPNYLDISCEPNTTNGNFLYFNNPTDLTVPQRRFGMDPAQYGGVPLAGNNATNPVTNATYACYPTIGMQNSANTGADLLLADVLSFEVKVLVAGQTVPLDLYSIPAALNNPNFTSNGPLVFDTWSSYRDTNPNTGMPSGYDYYAPWINPAGGPAQALLPMAAAGTQHGPIRILALEITVRVWDFKTEQARQITILQDM